MSTPNPSEYQPGTVQQSREQHAISGQGSSVATGRFLKLRQPIHPIFAIVLGLLCVAICFGLWWYLTKGDTAEDRIIPYTNLRSPYETFSSFPSLWTDRAFLPNLLATLRTLIIGFGLATIIGIPLGVAAGCFPPVHAFLTPLVLFGRNIPIAALIPLMFALVTDVQAQKVMFIFIACVAFIIADTAVHVMSVGQQYIDTAYTLGAKRRHVILRVLVPLAMPSIFNSLRLLFGLAFGYIMLAETIKQGSEAAGLGNLITTSQRRSKLEHIQLIILIIPIVAFAIDRCLYWAQRQLFPYRYGGAGWLRRLFKAFALLRQDVKRLIWKPTPTTRSLVDEQLAAFHKKYPTGLDFERIPLSTESIAEWRP